MTILSKPLFFNSRLFPLTDKINQSGDFKGAHFWVNIGGQIRDPSDVMPGMEGRKRVYVPFPKEEQEVINDLWWENQKRLHPRNSQGEMEFLVKCLGGRDHGENGKCFYNAHHYQLLHGGRIEIGAFGHRMDDGVVELDFGV